MQVKFTARDAGNLDNYGGYRIWVKPNPLATYAIGADVAEGVGKDASVAQVIDVKSGLHVCSYWNNGVDCDNFAAELFKLGNFYNNAWICVESNNHGNAVISHLSGAIGGLAYPRLYKRYEYDQFVQRKTKVVGFKTTAQTKPRLVGNLKEALRDGLIQTSDRYTAQEINAYIIDERGKMGAKGTSHDDRVMALALAWEQARLLRETDIKQEKDLTPQIKYNPITGFPESLL